MANLQQFVMAYGVYVSPIKLAVFAVLFFGWLPLVNWVYSDTQAVKTKVQFWTLIISATGAGGLIALLLVPFFPIGLLLYIVALGAVTMAYIVHRNSRVADFERVLSINHIKGIFVNEDKKISKASRGMSFVTANNNEVPLPTSKSPEAFGFKVACDVFEDADWRRASIVLFKPSAQQEYTVVYVIDGQLTNQPSRTREEVEYFLHYIKQLADVDINEKRKPQTGCFKAKKGDDSVEWELTTAGSTAGEQARLTRVEEYTLMKLDDIGLTEKQLVGLKKVRDCTKGLFIISGPKRSGVTTTFYAMLRNHDPFMNDINTLEKKPAAEIDNITQNVFALSDTGTTTYSKRLQSILRMGTNIMGIAECEDSSCAQLACEGANSDRMIHVTFETESAIKALAKWLKMIPDRAKAVDNLVGIINQRLVRKLCVECKQAYQPNQELLKKFNIPSEKLQTLYRPGEIEYDKHGREILCEHCQGTGFFERTGIFEIIILDDAIREGIKAARSLQEIATLFRRSGMLSLQEEAIKKVAAGTTSINEAIRELSVVQKKTKPKSNSKKQ